MDSMIRHYQPPYNPMQEPLIVHGLLPLYEAYFARSKHTDTAEPFLEWIADNLRALDMYPRKTPEKYQPHPTTCAHADNCMFYEET